MGALDKLNARAKKEPAEVVTEKKEQTKKEVVSAKTEKAESDAVTKTEKQTKSQPASTPKKKPAAKKHPGGRPNTRGNYKMVNVALSADLYNRIQEVCMGNMTYYFNDVLKKSVGM